MKALLLFIAFSFIFTNLVFAGTNSFPKAGTEADFERLMKENEERIKRGEKPLPIQLSEDVDKKLVGKGVLPSHDAPHKKSARFRLFYKNAPLSFIFEDYTKFTGKTVKPDKDISASISLSHKERVSKKEAIKLIEETLLEKGIEIVPIDKKTVRAKKKNSTTNTSSVRGKPRR